MNSTELGSLRKEVERTFRRKVLSSIDCLQLSDEIFNRTGERLNFNTLRRCFGLVKSAYPPSQNTIALLCKYCGFHSLEELVSFSLKLEQEEGTYNKGLLSYLVGLFQNLEVKGAHDTTCLSFIQYTLSVLHQEPELIMPLQRAIAKCRNGQEYYFEQFVQLDQLNHYYGEGLRFYLQEKREDEAQVFGHSLLALRAWLSGDEASLDKHYGEVMQAADVSAHSPRTCGYYFATRLLHAEAAGADSTEVLQEAQDCYQRFQTSLHRYQALSQFEESLSTALLLTGQYEEALYYCERALASLRGHKTNLSDSSALVLRLYQAVACAFSGAEDKAEQLYEAIDPADFPLLSKQYLTLLYLLLGAHLQRSRRYEEQVEHLVGETGFTRLAAGLAEQVPLKAASEKVA
ncbi:MAG TPA: hypothetical protein VHK69_11330 [Chitinophagaceae bacterium]|jgi:tetratricopeptide (TPR) repeat protein|nr:hypothetical protein [Chitinophagaceae bacterium]